jgi:multiple sugar transport system ATP-binding protein
MFALSPHMSVRQNIAFPLVSQGMPRVEIAERVAQAANTLHISHLLNMSVSGLTSGDRQRVALGRAIVRQPMAFMMDEPLGALDAEFRELMCQELRALHDRLHATTVYVTHDQREAMSMADKIAIMNQGVIEQLGAPQEIYERPASVFVADFMGSPSMNFIPTHTALARGATSIQLGSVAVDMPAVCDDVSQRQLLYGVRPEHIRLASDAPLRAEVVGVEYLGNCQVITLNTALNCVVRAKVDVDIRAVRGDQVGLELDASEMTLFDQASGRAIRTARDDLAVEAIGTRKAAHG